LAQEADRRWFEAAISQLDVVTLVLERMPKSRRRWLSRDGSPLHLDSEIQNVAVFGIASGQPFAKHAQFA
jgi:hypothetical protein